jgi:hypothetical protein
VIRGEEGKQLTLQQARAIAQLLLWVRSQRRSHSGQRMKPDTRAEDETACEVQIRLRRSVERSIGTALIRAMSCRDSMMDRLTAGEVEVRERLARLEGEMGLTAR